MPSAERYADIEAAREEERKRVKMRVVRIQKGPYMSGGLRCVDMYVRDWVGIRVV